MNKLLGVSVVKELVHPFGHIVKLVFLSDFFSHFFFFGFVFFSQSLSRCTYVSYFKNATDGSLQRLFMISYLDEEILVTFLFLGFTFKIDPLFTYLMHYKFIMFERYRQVFFFYKNLYC